MIRLLTLSLFASVCLGELIPVSSYIGQHKSECGFRTFFTGALVQDKIYTFGGCYPIPYIVTPILDGIRDYSDSTHNNISETIQIYDIKKDEWTHETEVKLPFPWRTAYTQTYKQDIYFHTIRSEDQHENISKMWKYDTILKEFSAMDDLPFNWLGDLKTCVSNGKMYFVGDGDGRQRNIIQVYNIESGVWEKPLFPNLRFLTKQVLCGENDIQFLGPIITEKDKPVFSFGEPDRIHEVIRVDYKTGDSVLIGLSAALTEHYNPIIKTNNGKFYNFDVKREKTIITIIDTVASEVTRLEPLPHALANPLFVPYQDDVLYLFGGAKRRTWSRNKPKSTNSLKKYNHKLVLESTAKFVLQNK